MLTELAGQHGVGEILVERSCPQCGGVLHYKGEKPRTVLHPEGQPKLTRGYHHCDQCGHGFFPLDERLQLGAYSWSPATVAQALRLGVEIPSYRRAVVAFGELLHLPLSKSSLQQLVKDAGQALVGQEAAEAEAMVSVPSKEEEVMWRDRPAPDSEIMNVSSDGVLIHLRQEGWKEVKTLAISAVEPVVNPATGEVEVQLTHHSYRAGLWEATTFANHLWAEAGRRGLEQAHLVVSVNDGAVWIWTIVFMCFARCVQILDWWHAVQYLWLIASAAFREDSAQATIWVEQQKQLLAQSNLRQVLHNVRLLYPRRQPLPDTVRKAVFYLFHHRWRMRYREFRQAAPTGHPPIGSGTVESACKVVVQQRMKQAGMQWSRSGAQAMLALRCALLSGRWSLILSSATPT